MIKSIRIQNFQSHENTYVEFTEGVNTFIGKTDSGKSACIRALKWVKDNRPTGDSFINRKAFADGKQIAPCIVTIETDKHVVSREKSASVNCYTVDGQVFNAVGVSIPDEVTEALNMNDINMQLQMNSPFLLTESPPEVARMLNRVVKLDDIDTTMRQLHIYLSRLNTEKSSTAMQLAKKQEDIAKIHLQDIEQMVELGEILEANSLETDAKLEHIKQLQYDIALLNDRLKTDVERISTLIEEGCKYSKVYDEVYEQVLDLTEFEQAFENLNNVYPLVDIDVEFIDMILESYTGVAERLHLLIELQTAMDVLLCESVYKDIDVASIDVVYSEYDKLEERITLLDTLEFGMKPPVYLYSDIDCAYIEKTLQEYTQLQEDMDVLQELEDRMTMIDTAIEERTISINEMIVELGNVCPLCGNAIHEECV